MVRKEKSSLKINDRRRFTAEGTSREQEEAPSEEIPEADLNQTSPEENQSSAQNEETASQFQADEMTNDFDASFNALLISLATSAQSALGLGSTLGQAEVKNLEQAKHAIDLLEMLEKKTQGNLSSQEAQGLQTLLYELRMLYVQAQQEMS